MPRIIHDATWRQLMEELDAYRASGLSPDQVMQLADKSRDPAPQPLNLWAEDIHVAAGLLEDDGYDPALEAQTRHDEQIWHK